MAEWKCISLNPTLAMLYKCSHLYVYARKQEDGLLTPFEIFSRWPLKGLRLMKPYITFIGDTRPAPVEDVSWHEFLESLKRKFFSPVGAPFHQECAHCGIFGVSSNLLEKIRNHIEEDLLNSVWGGSLCDLVYRCCIVQGYVPRYLRVIDYDTVIHCELPRFFPLVLCQLIGDYVIQYIDDELFRTNKWFSEKEFEEDQWNFWVKLHRQHGSRLNIGTLNSEDLSTMIQIQQGPPHTFRHFIVSQFWSRWMTCPPKDKKQ